MSSHRPFPLEALDLLIVDALRTQVGDAEPSARVWERIRRRAKTWAARGRFRLGWYAAWEPTRMSRGHLPVPSSAVIAIGGLTGLGCDIGAVRFPSYAGICRSGW